MVVKELLQASEKIDAEISIVKYSLVYFDKYSSIQIQIINGLPICIPGHGLLPTAQSLHN